MSSLGHSYNVIAICAVSLTCQPPSVFGWYARLHVPLSALSKFTVLITLFGLLGSVYEAKF